MAEYKSYSDMRRDFYQKYQHKIVPCVGKHDAERKKKLKLAIFGSTTTALLGFLVLFSIFKYELDGDAGEGAFKLAIFLFVVSYCIWLAIKKEFESKIKAKIMPTICSCFENLIWSESSYKYGQIFSESGVIPSFSGAYYDDIFMGSHREVNIEIVEGEFDIGSGKNRRTVFDGVIVKLDMNKEFTSHTIIAPDTIFHQTPLEDLRHTVLEDVEFEKKFDVFTNDEVDARYLITPSFMQRLKAMKTAFKADKIKCAFYGNLLLVALSTNKDLFSLCSLVKSIDDAQQYFQMFEEILSIIKLIDHFKLDQKIGL